ncbi:succinate dehydrogenase/fumarate reductase iron-sulfur subunit [Enhygromyxa salina]|uniref:Succinate dehydrogenase iron-sulfur subunit n=1 Tax=Enhygromyxa salina TaxID=215803 RepID=A0A2S9YQN4_9BACT|nr:succinate dehydrogenase/fumarate reductase iron-sulfur subunit [Enhygromyxa salina]PRQ07415.1 Fumarate reductase iron-sulfur subunit [Enhygromyxa salina]
MDIKLKIWRQSGPKQAGFFEDHRVEADPHMSFLEMLDVLNEQLLEAGKDAVAFDHDCREGICGACSMVIDGNPHGPRAGTTACQLHMREYHDGDEIVIEPWRAAAFPIVKDLVVDRSAFDRIQHAGGYVSVGTGSAPDANTIPIGKRESDQAFDYAACIGCGACVAACPNASAMLFVSSKVAHLSLLPQGKVERKARVRNMVAAMDAEGFGGCTNHGECEAACPKSISVDAIALLNREYLYAGLARD